MSGSVDVPAGARSSSSTFLKVLAVLLLALAAGEFLLVVHYHRQKVAAETVAPVLGEAGEVAYWQDQKDSNRADIGADGPQLPRVSVLILAQMKRN